MTVNSANLFMHSLMSFRNNANDCTFRTIFGTAIGDHIWAEFRRCDHDVIHWYATLDLTNAKLFNAWLTTKVAELQAIEAGNESMPVVMGLRGEVISVTPRRRFSNVSIIDRCHNRHWIRVTDSDFDIQVGQEIVIGYGHLKIHKSGGKATTLVNAVTVRRGDADNA